MVKKFFFGGVTKKKSKVLWFTGLSGSGKTTIALELGKNLKVLGKKIKIIDGDVVRNTLNKHLGFSREDIRENNRLIAILAKEELSQWDYILVPVISPFIEDRLSAKKIIGDDSFLELYVDCSLEECANRDTKGLYKKALSGEINNLIGVSSAHPYEPPVQPDIHIRTNIMSLAECLKEIKLHLQ